MTRAIFPHALSLILFISAPTAVVMAREVPDSASVELEDFVFVKKKASTARGLGTENSFTINQSELFRAACCNLGESFSTNPSVDVNYSDPATGARQIRLLGLDGRYVQMMAENIPDFRGAAMPYALRYVPGPWMKSISVSKGCASVKNGYESITGQINIAYLPPDDEPGAAVNAYLDSELKMELNADANFRISPTLSTEVLAHYEDRFMSHDTDHDTFTDSPDVRQINVQNRWKLVSGTYRLHAGASMIAEWSRAGQRGAHAAHLADPFHIDLNTRRGNAYMKHAFILDPAHGGNLAVVGSMTVHRLDATYGRKLYDVNEKNAYAQILYETDIANPDHKLSAGLSLNYDFLGQRVRRTHDAGADPERIRERETTPGGYLQYTFSLKERLSVMAGVRGDHSSRYGWFVTPRFNVKYSPADFLNLRASAGSGSRTVHPWAEYSYLLASGRTLVVENLSQERAWNYGFSADATIRLGRQELRFNAEYFHTRFSRQAVVDYDSDPGLITVSDLNGKSRSHTLQLDATLTSSFGLTATAAWRLNRVKSTYGGVLLDKPLTSRYKMLLTASYSTPLELWQFDVTFALNGPGRLPAPFRMADGTMSWPGEFKAFPTLNIQVTRWFRHFSIYAGGENLTDFRQKNPIVNAADPWGTAFEPTVIWGPTHGAMAYVGIRFNFGNRL